MVPAGKRPGGARAARESSSANNTMEGIFAPIRTRGTASLKRRTMAAGGRESNEGRGVFQRFGRTGECAEFQNLGVGASNLKGALCIRGRREVYKKKHFAMKFGRIDGKLQLVGAF
jgi:hypothetical protein